MSRMSAKARTYTLLAVPLLYLLTAPPVAYAVQRRVPMHFDFVGLSFDLTEAHLRAYAGPYRWLLTNTSLGGPLRAYADWWGQTLGVR